MRTQGCHQGAISGHQGATKGSWSREQAYGRWSVGRASRGHPGAIDARSRASARQVERRMVWRAAILLDVVDEEAHLARTRHRRQHERSTQRARQEESIAQLAQLLEHDQQVVRRNAAIGQRRAGEPRGRDPRLIDKEAGRWLDRAKSPARACCAPLAVGVRRVGGRGAAC